MEISFEYFKPRRLFGRQYTFYPDGPRLVEDCKPDKSLAEKYIIKNIVDNGTQVGDRKSRHEVNTPSKETCDRGMNHLEGGWPKEVDTNDDEVLLRFRRKVERLDNYIASMQRLTKPMEHAILQNNAVNIYQTYFSDMVQTTDTEIKNCRIENTFADLKYSVPVSHCSWSPESTKFAVAHCVTQFQQPLGTGNHRCHIWNIEKPTSPIITFDHEDPIFCLEYHPKDVNTLAAGIITGQIGCMDARKGGKPVNVSISEYSHHDPVHSIIWTNSKTGAEIFSTSSDGVVKWWDIRSLKTPFEEIILDMTKGGQPNVNRAYAASCLEYDQTMPARYMVGTESGYVISGNRKGTNQQDKLPWIIKTHDGPVRSIHRNQAFNKHFLTVGTYSLKIWSEDCKESAIIWSRMYSKCLTQGEWSGGRASVFFAISQSGILDLYDILINQKSPTISLKLTDSPLTALRVKEDGLKILVGDAEGKTHLVQFPTIYGDISKEDKFYLMAMFDREARREKVLEGKTREIKLRQRELMLQKEAAMEEKPPEKTEFEIQMENYMETLENDYFEEIQKNKRQIKMKKSDALLEEEEESNI